MLYLLRNPLEPDLFQQRGPLHEGDLVIGSTGKRLRGTGKRIVPEPLLGKSTNSRAAVRPFELRLPGSRRISLLHDPPAMMSLERLPSSGTRATNQL